MFVKNMEFLLFSLMTVSTCLAAPQSAFTVKAIQQPASAMIDVVNLSGDRIKSAADTGTAVIHQGLDLALQRLNTGIQAGREGINKGAAVAEQGIGLLSQMGRQVPEMQHLVKEIIQKFTQSLNTARTMSNKALEDLRYEIQAILQYLSDSTVRGNKAIKLNTDNVANSIKGKINSGAQYLEKSINNHIDSMKG